MKKKQFSEKLFLLASMLMSLHPLLLKAEAESPTTVEGNPYTLIVSGFDWGPAANKVVLPMGTPVTEVHADHFQVSASRNTPLLALPAGRNNGNRDVVFAYISDADGNRTPTGEHITLVLSVGPDDPIASPMEYIENRNHWIHYALTITNSVTDQVWNTETRRIRPIVDDFDLSGMYRHENGQTLTYAAFEPKTKTPANDKSPLIIWLHGGGEGGTDPSIALMANLASNYASTEIQAIFGGAYVLAPQTPTFWMQTADGSHTTGEKEDIQNGALMGLIQHFVDTHPGVDPDRIYIGGCSNGGYMSLKLILLYPEYFAAGYISALGYFSEFLTDAQIATIKDVPIWFVHSADDMTLRATDTVIPIYNRLIAAGAQNVHFSFYDHVVDIRGFFGGEDYWYYGHLSWIYCHANTCRFDYDGTPVTCDGKPVTIMEWMASQHR